MLENLGFFHISSKNPVDADIANRKHYSAPAGAVTMFLGSSNRFSVLMAMDVHSDWLHVTKIGW